MKKRVLETKELTLWFHEETGIVHHELHRYPGVTTLEAALEQGLDLLQEHGACKWLSDDRKGGALPKAHHEWAESNWGPRAARAGWRYWALLPPTALLGQGNMTRIQAIYSALGIEVRVFSSPTEAFAWLKACGSAMGVGNAARQAQLVDAAAAGREAAGNASRGVTESRRPRST